MYVKDFKNLLMRRPGFEKQSQRKIQRASEEKGTQMLK